MEKSIQEQIVEYHNSKEYGNLIKYQQQKSFFHIFKLARDENSHSDFWAWLLNPNESHSLHTYPLEKFLNSLIIPINGSQSFNKNLKISDKLKNLIVTQDYEISGVDVIRELKFKEKILQGNKEESIEGSIDLFISFTLTRKRQNSNPMRVNITIENKVKSNEFNSQTLRYSQYMETIYKNQNNLLIYLTPLNHLKYLELKEPECESKNFLQLNYQHLLNTVLEPIIKKDLLLETRFIIQSYIRSLSYPSLETDKKTNAYKGDLIMAISSEEKELLLDFWESQKDLLLKVFTAIQDDEELNSDESQKIKEAVSIAYSNLSGRDRTQYKFGENTYGKGRLVHAVVKQYIEEHKNIKFEDLLNVFPDEIQGKYGIIKIYDKEIEENKNTYARDYFLREDEPLEIGDNKKIMVCRQWGSNNYNPELGNFFWFFKKANELYPGIIEIK